jgi:hypothetical protein
MAGSYQHCVNRSGQFVGIPLIDNLGDAYEALEEMYGMIWYLAGGDPAKVEAARQGYTAGIVEHSPGVGVLTPDDDDD